MSSMLVNKGHMKPLGRIGRKRISTSPVKTHITVKHSTLENVQKDTKNNIPSVVVNNSNSKQTRVGISICLTAYNTADYIEECLDSIESQTYFIENNDYEVLLGIDGCEKTLKKVQSIRKKYRNLRVFMMKENVGTYITTNTMISKAKYPWILRFDTDDIMLPEMISTLMSQKGSADIIRFKMERFPDHAQMITYGQVLVRKAILDEYGCYMPWRCNADNELVARLQNVAKPIVIDAILMRRRSHPDSLTNSKETAYDSPIRSECYKYIRENSRIKPKIETVTFDATEISNIELDSSDKIIVSFTSWKKRIQYCAHIVDLMLQQTIKPTKIILNLSSDEFVNKENDLPEELVKKQNDIFEIYWVKENTKVYKKVIPTLERFPDDIIISIDDDIDYPTNFIEEQYAKYKATGKKSPITSGMYVWGNDNYTDGDEIYTHHGSFSLIKNYFFGSYLKELYENIVLRYGVDKIPFENLIFTYAALLNGKRYCYTEKLDMTNIKEKSQTDKENRVGDANTCLYKDRMSFEHKVIQKYINAKYNKSYKDLTSSKLTTMYAIWSEH